MILTFFRLHGSQQKTNKVSISSPEKVKVGGDKRHIPSASTALVLGLFLGVCQTIFLFFGAKMPLGIMGIKHVISFFEHHLVQYVFSPTYKQLLN